MDSNGSRTTYFTHGIAHARVFVNDMDSNGSWTTYFTPRELKEIQFAQIYMEKFDHGTDGHNAKIIIAKMAILLNANPINNLPPLLPTASQARAIPDVIGGA